MSFLSKCEQLYQIAERLRDEGVSIILITHKFEDMYRLATRVTVFRDSKYIGQWDVDKISNQKLIAEMVGRELSQMYPEKTAKIGDVVFEVDDISKMLEYPPDANMGDLALPCFKFSKMLCRTFIR